MGFVEEKIWNMSITLNTGHFKIFEAKNLKYAKYVKYEALQNLDEKSQIRKYAKYVKYGAL